MTDDHTQFSLQGAYWKCIAMVPNAIQYLKALFKCLKYITETHK